MDDLKSRLKAMIVERLFLPVKAEDIADNASLMDTYGVDSVALFELAVGLEDEFGVAMEDVDFKIDSFRDVNAIAELVRDKTQA